MARTIKELDDDFLRELRQHTSSSDDFASTMNAYLVEHWTLEEIEDYATVYDAASRYEREAATNHFLRPYWAEWVRIIADYKSKASFQKIDIKQIMCRTPKAVNVLMPGTVEETAVYQNAIQKAASDAAATIGRRKAGRR